METEETAAMARFPDASDNTILSMLGDGINKPSKSTKKATKSAVNVFRTYLQAKGLDKNFESLSSAKLDDILNRFYVEARTEQGSYYTWYNALN